MIEIVSVGGKSLAIGQVMAQIPKSELGAPALAIKGAVRPALFSDGFAQNNSTPHDPKSVIPEEAKEFLPCYLLTNITEDIIIKKLEQGHLISLVQALPPNPNACLKALISSDSITIPDAASALLFEQIWRRYVTSDGTGYGTG